MQTSSVAESGGRRAPQRRKEPGLRRAWCCSFGVPPQSPENRGGGGDAAGCSRRPQAKPPKPSYAASFHSSPSPSARVGRGLMDPRRILSPGRVSPIDSDAPLRPLPEAAYAPAVAAAAVAEAEVESVDVPPRENAPEFRRHLPSSSSEGVGGARSKERSENSCMDLRLSVKGKDGKCLVFELDSEVLCQNSTFFAAMVLDARRRASDASEECQRIEVAEVEDLSVFKDTIELMYAKDAMRWLAEAGVPRSIDILEVSATIMFNRGVVSCLNYLEAVPWNESEEEKLKSLFSRCSFEEPIIMQDLLDRLYPRGRPNTQGLALHLIRSVANGTNDTARKVSQTLVNGLLSKSSVYQKDAAGLDEGGLYSICESCLDSLVDLFAEASGSFSADGTSTGRPTMIQRVSRHVDNLNWLLEILMEKQMAEEFVGVWANQSELVRLHGRASPMVRYELSRISACVFTALGRGKLQCPGGVRCAVLRSWFGPMLSDFGWLQRCSKGLDVRMLEESLGELVLTLSLGQQQALFVEWFRWFSAQGFECPNLSKAFQVWWRRSFVRAPDGRG